jgi:hypothetical protein
MLYDKKSGEISMPPSPPLYSWDEKLPFGSEKKRDPLLAWREPGSHSPKQRIKKPWLSVLLCAGASVAFIFFIFWMNPV